MNVDEAARATRKYKMEWMACDNGSVIEFVSSDSPDNQAACDRLNLIAVLEAIREPSEAMVWAPPSRANQSPEDSMYAGIYRAMIDALIAEVKEQK